MATYKQFHDYAVLLKHTYGVKVTSKDQYLKPLWKAIHWFFKIISFGKMKDFYTEYTTTIGNHIFFPAGWCMAEASKQDYITLRHEAVHIKQYDSLGIGSAAFGTLIMGLLYLLVPFPIFFAWFRYKFEREAYCETIRATRELGGTPPIEWYVEALTGPSYLWTWFSKKQVKKWFEEHC